MNRNVRILFLAFWLLSASAAAQMDEFQQEFKKAYSRYLSDKTVMVVQHYLFTLDSANAVPFDSGNCYIEKNDLTIHYLFNGVESFSDGTYLIRISNPGKYMVVSKSNHSDSSAPGFIFKEGFSGFKNVEKNNNGIELTFWKLSGGTNGVLTAEITFDTREARIVNILSELSPDNPIISRINIQRQGMKHNVFIRIDYAYTTKLNNKLPQLSDYIHVENNVVTAAEKFKDYQIKIIK